MKTGVALRPLSASVPHLSQTTIEVLSASQFANDNSRSLGSPNRSSGARKIGINIEVAQISESLLSNPPDPLVYLGPSIAAPSSAPAFQRQQSSPTPPVMAAAAVSLSIHLYLSLSWNLLLRLPLVLSDFRLHWRFRRTQTPWGFVRLSRCFLGRRSRAWFHRNCLSWRPRVGRQRLASVSATSDDGEIVNLTLLIGICPQLRRNFIR